MFTEGVSNQGDWVWGIQEQSVLSLQLSVNPKLFKKFKFLYKKNDAWGEMWTPADRSEGSLFHSPPGGTALLFASSPTRSTGGDRMSLWRCVMSLTERRPREAKPQWTRGSWPRSQEWKTPSKNLEVEGNGVPSWVRG